MALLLEPPLSFEVDGLRRALGAPERTRIAPHITLVPPINLRDEGVDAARALLARVAAELTPFSVTIGPATTFAPVTPTVHLEVSGRGESALRYLRSALVESDPFIRPDPHPFVPHVTLIQELAPASGIDAAVALLSSFEVEATFEAVHLLVHDDDRVWRPIQVEKLTKSVGNP